MKKKTTTKRGVENNVQEHLVPFLDEMKSFMHSALRESERSVKEDLKDFVRSTAKGTEAVLGKRIDKVEKKVDSLDGGVESLKTDVKQLQVAVLENAKSIKEMRTEMHGMEERLGNKIDKNAIRFDDHATRITTLEEAR